MPSAASFAAVFGPMPWNRPTGSVSTNAGPMRGVMTNSPSGLRWSDASLASNLLYDTPAEAVSPVSRGDARADLPRDRGGGAEVAQRLRHVQIGLVERQRLDQRRVVGEDRVDLPRHRLVHVEARRHEHELRAHPPRRHRGHRRAHAETPRLVARRRHHAAFAAPADRHRPAAQRRVVALLDRGVERIHVDMDDPARRIRHAWPPCQNPVRVAATA